MKDKFADKAANWDKNDPRLLMIKSFVTEIEQRSSLNPKSYLLDFGCGTGLVGLEFAERIARVTLVDNSPAMLEILRQKIKEKQIINANVIEGNIDEVKKTATEDLIVSMMALHHVASIPNLLKKFHSLLNIDGKVIIGDLLTEDGSFHFPETVPHNGFEKTILTDQVIAAGFKIEHFGIFHTMNCEISTGEIKSFDLFLLVACKI